MVSYQQRIQEVRIRHKQSIESVAKAIHLSTEEYEAVEKGERELYAHELLLMKRYYGMSADDLLGLRHEHGNTD